MTKKKTDTKAADDSAKTTAADVAPYLSKKTDSTGDVVTSSDQGFFIPIVLVLILGSLIFTGFFKQSEESLLSETTPPVQIAVSESNSENESESLFEHLYLSIKDFLLVDQSSTSMQLEQASSDNLISVADTPEVTPVAEQPADTTEQIQSEPDVQSTEPTVNAAQQPYSGYNWNYRPYPQPYAPAYPPSYGYGYQQWPTPYGSAEESTEYMARMKQRQQLFEEARNKQLEAMKKREEERRAWIKQMEEQRAEAYRAYQERTQQLHLPDTEAGI